MKHIWTSLFVMIAFNANAVNIQQNTKGWCSPAIADNKGKITIVCNDIDSITLKYLYDYLDKTVKDLNDAHMTINDLIKKVEQGIRINFELKHLIDKRAPESELAAEAKQLLHEHNLEEGSITLTAAVAHMGVGKITVHAGVNVKKNQTVQPVGDNNLIIYLQSIESADNPGTQVIRPAPLPATSTPCGCWRTITTARPT